MTTAVTPTPSRPIEGTSAPTEVGPLKLRASLKTEMMLSLAVLGTAALSLAALNAVVLETLTLSKDGPIYLALLVLADILIFVAFGAYKIQGLVLDPLDTVVETTEAIADGDLSRRVPRTGPTEFSRLARSINRMTARILEEQAQRTHLEKVASVGRLAAGVAHEIGNPLGAIGGYAHILRKTATLDSDAKDAVAGIERETARIARIMRGMLEYARPRRRITSRIDLNVTVNEVVQLLRDQGTLREVSPEVALQHGLPKLVGDAHELRQTMLQRDLRRYFAKRSLIAQQLHDLVDGDVEVDARRDASARARVLQHAAHDASDARGLALDAGHCVLGVGVEYGALAQDVSVATDGAERVADFVGDAGGKPAHARDLFEVRALRLFLEDTRRHAVDAACEARELGWTGARDAAREIAVGDRLRCLDYGIERIEHEPLNLSL